MGSMKDLLIKFHEGAGDAIGTGKELLTQIETQAGSYIQDMSKENYVVLRKSVTDLIEQCNKFLRELDSINELAK